MPVSRNRKKKKNTNQFTNRPRTFSSLLDVAFKDLQNCKACGTTREELTFLELPMKHKDFWIQSELFSSIEYFLHCSTCQESSALFMTEEI
jgi:hypothetical protein